MLPLNALNFILLEIQLPTADIIKQYLWLVIIAGCVIISVGIFIGLFIGYFSLKKTAFSEIETQAKAGSVQRSIIENVGIGIVAYADNKPIYANRALNEMKSFLTTGGVPKTFERFLDTYDKDNHLKSDYLLSKETDGFIRVNYKADKKVFEIKIVRCKPEYIENIEGTSISSLEIGDSDGYLDIVLVEDITQIKDDERRQKDLAANVSHELKTPLTVIRASEFFIKNLKPDKMPTYEEIAKWGNRILCNAIRMQDIVEDFLVLSMSAQTKKMVPFNIGDEVERAISNISDYPSAENVRIYPPKKDAYPLCFGNKNLIVRVITNLLTNAAKYIDYEGKTVPHEIKINIVTIGDRIGVQVADNGRGIPKDDIDHLTERFFRVDNSGSRDVGGSGLGLAIAKEIAELHDGNISVVSELKQGSTFTFIFPTAASCFDRVYEDATAGVMSEIPYYRAVADYLMTEIPEFSESKGYKDVLDKYSEYKNLTAEGDEDAITTSEISCIAALGNERYESLKDELTYVEFFDDEDFDDEEFDDEYDEEFDEEAEAIEEVLESEESTEVIPIVSKQIVSEPNVSEPNVSEPNADDIYNEQELMEFVTEAEAVLDSDAEADEINQQAYADEEERQRKREMQEFLLQPVVQQSVKMTNHVDEPQKESDNSEFSSEKGTDLVSSAKKEKVQIHPKTNKKMYNGTGRNLFGSLGKTKNNSNSQKKSQSEDSEYPIKSAVRKALDEAEGK